MNQHSRLVEEAEALYEAYQLDRLPRALQRNSLDYYYLSVYPSISEMREVDPPGRPQYPELITNAYVHIPFCSGVCDFCSYYLVALSPRRTAAIARYLEHVKLELDFHARHANLDIGYLYLGGGTPSLIPPDTLESFLEFIAERRYLSPDILGTVELHPEFFEDGAKAVRFLATLQRYGIGRVSVGYQASDDDLLHRANRRHTKAFMAGAMALLRSEGFLVNVDLMYGLPGQSLESWQTTLRDAIAFAPESISTYFLFVDRGTGLYEQVRRGKALLPSHRHIQTQHLMAGLTLTAAGYHELPNDYWARGVRDPGGFQQESLPSAATTLPVGPGSYGHYDNTQLCNVFDLGEYERRVEGNESPLWRAHRLSQDEAFSRDIMFSLKNDPYLDCGLFQSAYNRSPLEQYGPTFDHLLRLELVAIGAGRIALTDKGKLCVEEIAALFRHPNEPPENDVSRKLLQKHNYASAYPAVEWQ